MIPLYYNTRSLLTRRLSTGVTVLGLGLVVFVFAAVLMLSNGIEQALAAGGSADNVVLLRAGATSEVASAVERDAVRIVATWPEVASATSGEPLAVGELVVLVGLPGEGDTFMNITARGVTGASFDARPTVRLAEGRRPKPGTTEIVIGSSLVGGSAGTFVGGELEFAQERWPVVGRIEAEGSAFESELWVDRERLGQAFNRTGFSSALVRLSSAAGFAQFKQRVESDPRLELDAEREDRYWADQASVMATFIRVLGLFVSVVFSFGAVLGAMITMFAQVSSRIRELGMMRAVGFSRRSVLAAVVIESGLLGVAGGLSGALAALSMRWVKISTLNFQTFSQVTFGFAPTPGILAAAVVFGTAMGLVGGLLPALKAARLGILDALRA